MNDKLDAIRNDVEIKAFIEYWTTKSRKKCDQLVDKFDDYSVAQKLKKFLAGK